ncbi:MAG: hypothetical protein CMG21_00565 [Candidatus Marinimicrobia bacterium]|nr:hypothetical protein [Candidatus Neomarinimicrobiota bacterium]|tara:strand:+ start:35 stop:1036 length:1002 start_codon:yes stop_codon:yes gene_type:complete
MYKKITLLLIFILFSCESNKKTSKGNFNDLVILSSIEDRMMLENIINNNIFLDTIFTPEPESIFNKIWIKPDQFKHYKEYSNLLLISISDPPDKTIDLLIDKIIKNNNIESFPIFFSDVYSSNQLISVVKEFNQDLFEENLDSSFGQINSITRNHMNSLYYNRYQDFPNDTLISNLAYKLFGHSFYFRQDFKIIDYSKVNNSKYLWIGRGDIYAENSTYQWLIIKDLNEFITEDNIELLKVVQNNIKEIIPEIEIVSKYSQFSVEENNNYIIYKINALYNHNSYKTGGPLLSFIFKDKKDNKNKIIFALVNAPGQNKLNAIKELESIVINSIF